MKKAVRSLLNLMMGVMTCILIIGLSINPSFSKTAVTSVDIAPMQWSSDLLPESDTLAQGMMGESMKRYQVMLGSQNVVPNSPSTMATGMAEATLKGDRLTVRGSFSQLSSALRDYAVDPVNPPNPKITSAVHIHRGEATANGPFQFALTVKTNGKSMGGKFSGRYTLSPEQLQALSEGKLYIDLHTQQNRTGELRGAFQAVS
jgi:hypothetical protein